MNKLKKVSMSIGIKFKYAFSFFLDLILIPKTIFFKIKLSRIKKRISEFEREKEIDINIEAYRVQNRYKQLKVNAILEWMYKWRRYDVKKMRDERLNKYLNYKYLDPYDETYKNKKKTSKFLV